MSLNIYTGALAGALAYAIYQNQTTKELGGEPETSVQPLMEEVARLATEYRRTGIPMCDRPHYNEYGPQTPNEGSANDFVTTTGDPYIDAAYADILRTKFFLRTFEVGQRRPIFNRSVTEKVPQVITTFGGLPGLPEDYIYNQNIPTLTKLGRTHHKY